MEKQKNREKLPNWDYMGFESRREEEARLQERSEDNNRNPGKGAKEECHPSGRRNSIMDE